MKRTLTAIDEATVLNLFEAPAGTDLEHVLPLDTYHVADILNAYPKPTFFLLLKLVDAGKIERVGTDLFQAVRS